MAGEELKGIEEWETLIRVYCVRNKTSIFNKIGERVVCLVSPIEIPLEKANFSFADGHQLEIPSGSRMGAVVHLPQNLDHMSCRPEQALYRLPQPLSSCVGSAVCKRPCLLVPFIPSASYSLLASCSDGPRRLRGGI